MTIFALILSLYCLTGPMFIQGKMIEVQGHRGTRGLEPENTLPSFQRAIQAGADTLELDLLMTQDDKIVIYHDYFLDPDLVTYLDGRTLSSHTLLIRSLPLSQVEEFDCGRKANPRFPRQKRIPGTTMPTLEELFEKINASSDHSLTQRCD